MITGVKVSLPAGYIPPVPTPPPPPEVPDINFEHPYDYIYDSRIVIAIINAGMTDNIATYKLRMWLLGLPVINELIPPSYEVDFPATGLVPLLTYIQCKHPASSNARINHIFRAAHYLLSCHCTEQIRTEVLSWISEYNNSATPHS